MNGERAEPLVGSGSKGTEERSADSPAVSVAWGDEGHQDLKRNTARGALVSVVGQGATFVLRLGSMVVIARFVTPEQFGLVGMVTAFTGLVSLLRDGGLPQAAIQSVALGKELASTLFWLNLAIGIALTATTSLAAPLIALFYDEPRLLWITLGLSASFFINGAAAQHRALLQRRMRFGTFVAIDVAAVVVSTIAGVWMAIAGLGYSALVWMTIVQPLVVMVGAWIAARWIPGPPRRGTGAGSMLRYGGMLTLNSIVVYLAYNVDKILLGRFWGAEVLGLYGRAYQLSNIPTESLHSAMSAVMFPALARVQTDPQRVRNYFLKGYGLFLAIVMPTTLACGLFAGDIVRVLLGPQWTDAVPVFQLLAPTILAFALLNPMGYMMQATGRASRSLKMAFVIAPVVVLGYLVGLPFGATGVALGFSAAMLILVVPCVQWAKRDTPITNADLLRAALPPLASTLVGAAASVGAGLFLTDASSLVRLSVLTTVLFGVHALTLLFGLGEKETYLELLRLIRRREAGSDGNA